MLTAIIIWLALAIVIGIAAARRGRSGLGWLVASLILSPLIAAILLALLPDRRYEEVVRQLAAQKVTTVLCETPTVIAGHAFTTGKITRRSSERVLPNTLVEFGIKDGLGCSVGHYLPAEMEGKIVPDEHIHEHATCFNVRDFGLVVISSCGHVGIVNSVRQAQEVSGIKKVHAVVGGFHLGPAPADYLKQVVAEVKALEPDVVVPMHCSGLNFVQEATAQMGDKVMVTTTGAASSVPVVGNRNRKRSPPRYTSSWILCSQFLAPSWISVLPSVTPQVVPGTTSLHEIASFGFWSLSAENIGIRT